MAKLKAVRIRQELLEQAKKEVERGQYQNLSEFVSEAIRLRMQRQTKERISEYLERDKQIKGPQLQAQLFCTPNHIWAQATPQGTVKIGMTNYFEAQLKEIVNIRTDEAGARLSRDEPFGVVETWWFTYDLYPPLNGKIISVNEAILDDPFALKVDPYRWIVEIEPEDKEADSWMKGLLRFEEYEKAISTP